jgi:hypothetical protein
MGSKFAINVSAYPILIDFLPYSCAMVILLESYFWRLESIMDISLIQGTIAGFKLASDIAKSLLKLKTISEVQAKVVDLQDAILSAQNSALAANAHQTAMVEEIRSLKEEIAHIKAWKKEKQRYKLISPWPGTVLYALKEKCAASEVPHWICTKCYEDRRKSILNPQYRTNGFVFICPTCKAEYQSPYLGTTPPATKYVSE